MRAWKAHYEAQGWLVRASGPDGYIATPPDAEGPFTVNDDPRHAICFHVYDAQTKQEVWSPPKPKKAPEPKPQKHRRGRKPVGA